MHRLTIITKYRQLSAREGSTLGQYSQHGVWEPMGGPQTLSGLHRVKSVFIVLCCYLPFSLSFSPYYAVAFSRISMLCGVTTDEYKDKDKSLSSIKPHIKQIYKI